MAVASRWYITVSMGDTRNEEATNPDNFRNAAGRDDGLLPMQTGVPAAAGSYLCQSMPTVQSLRPCAGAPVVAPGPVTYVPVPAR